MEKDLSHFSSQKLKKYVFTCVFQIFGEGIETLVLQDLFKMNLYEIGHR